MATLNLVPNPTVLVVQAGVFLVNFAIIKKLYVEPYLKLRDRREALTVGSKDEAERAIGECEQLTRDIEKRIGDAADSAKIARQKTRDQAVAKRAAVVQVATVESKKIVESVEKQVQQDLAAERLKVPSVVAALTEEVYKLALT